MQANRPQHSSSALRSKLCQTRLPWKRHNKQTGVCVCVCDLYF